METPTAFLDHLSNDQLQMGAEAIHQGVVKLRREGFLKSATNLEAVELTLMRIVRDREDLAKQDPPF